MLVEGIMQNLGTKRLVAMRLIPTPLPSTGPEEHRQRKIWRRYNVCDRLLRDCREGKTAMLRVFDQFTNTFSLECSRRNHAQKCDGQAPTASKVRPGLPYVASSIHVIRREEETGQGTRLK